MCNIANIDPEEAARRHGFESLAEMRKLIVSVNIQDYERVERFKKWQAEDGSKKGLLKLIEENK